MLLRNPIFCAFSGESGPPVPHPSGSAHENLIIILLFEVTVSINSSVCLTLFSRGDVKKDDIEWLFDPIRLVSLG